MALSDELPHPIPSAALAAFDPPAYFQQTVGGDPPYHLNNINNNNNSHVNIALTATKPTSNPTFDHRIKTNNSIVGLISPEDEQQLPCEQYKVFLDASHHERVDMIDNLVDVSVDIIDSIWPSPKHAKMVTTKGFICEILKRSKTTYFMLQLSLFYIFRVKRVVQAKLRMTAGQRRYQDDLMCCGRRMFLASLMVASKYIHDKSYRNKAWAEASGLTLAEINASELAFLQMIDYRLYVSKPTFEKWYDMLNQRLKQRKQPHPPKSLDSTASTSLQQQQQQRSYPQQYSHHKLKTPHAIQKPASVKMNGTLNLHAIKTATQRMTKDTLPSAMNTPPLSSESTIPTLSATTHYPSPTSPCFYHPDTNVRP